MQTYRSKKHHIAKGPGLQVRLVAREGLITEVEMILGESGIAWVLEADRSSPQVEKAIEGWLKQYAQGQEPTVELPLNLNRLPPFTSEVLHDLRKVPFGTVLSYQELAKKLFHPKAARAVGNACGRNPLPLFVPCHRVIASDRTLGGFSMGLSIKKALLAFEGISI